MIRQDWCKRIKNRKGMKNTKEANEKNRVAHLKEKNSMWKGDNVGYNALHGWIKRHKPKTELCECCNTNKSYDLANISQEYKRDVNDWEWLCRKCHMTKDGRILILLEFNKIKLLKNIKCLFCKKIFHPKLSITKFCSKSHYFNYRRI